MAESNYFPTIRRRLEQIAEYGLPYASLKGNHIQGKSIGKLPLDGKTFEVIIEDFKNTPFNSLIIANIAYSHNAAKINLSIKDYGEQLVKASGDMYTLDELSDRCDGIPVGELSKQNISHPIIDMRKCDVHAFYDRRTDQTHYFILPKPR